MSISRLALSAAALFAAIPHTALAVEGRFDWNHCYHGDTYVISHADNFVVGTLKANGPIKSNIPNTPMDDMSTLCLGSFQVIDGKYDAIGWCELIDRDGDKVIGDWTDGSSRTWKIRHGTGKFKGITAEPTTFSPIGQFRAPGSGMFQGCNRTAGVYRLP